MAKKKGKTCPTLNTSSTCTCLTSDILPSVIEWKTDPPLYTSPRATTATVNSCCWGPTNSVICSHSVWVKNKSNPSSRPLFFPL